ncbi:MAG: MarR family winged helix-turn-helix transcriptional regulator [Nitrospiraceae bacterium]
MSVKSGPPQNKSSLLEVVSRVLGDFQQRLAPLRVTPLQAGMILYLHRHPDAKVMDTAAGVGVAEPNLSAAVLTLIRKRWVTGHRAPDDRRVVRLRLTQQGEVLAR